MRTRSWIWFALLAALVSGHFHRKYADEATARRAAEAARASDRELIEFAIDLLSPENGAVEPPENLSRGLVDAAARALRRCPPGDVRTSARLHAGLGERYLELAEIDSARAHADAAADLDPAAAVSLRARVLEHPAP